MPKTYEPIATYTISSAQSNYTFTAIPGTYTDLFLVAAYQTSGTATFLGCSIRFNGDTASNYSTTWMRGTGSSANSSRNSSQSAISSFQDSSGTWSNGLINVQNYANTTTFKTVLQRCNNPSGIVEANVALWRKTPEAITTILYTSTNGANYAAGSTFTLYGIKAA